MNTSTMSNEQLAGQRLMIGFEGTELSVRLKHLIDRLKIGGVILFAYNIQSPDQVAKLCSSIQNYGITGGNLPLFIGVDQEGGQVARLKAPFTEFPGNPHMKSEGDAEEFARITAAELTQVGINMNMAPVMDIAPRDMKSIMADRAFGHEPELVKRMGITVIRHLQKNNIMAVAKHFPGIGRTTLDSHLDMPTFDAGLADLQAFDMIPFEASIANNVSGIMLSHILYSSVDPRWPASLSDIIARKILREQMGFEGLTLTDDLDMGAIAKRYDMPTIVDRAMAADIDIVMICHEGPNIELAFESILKRISDSPAMKAKAIRSVQRIMELKRRYLAG
jgi:beta-N-acetylhexosaminidase